MKIIEPGAIKTDFYNRSADAVVPKGGDAYADYYHRASAKMQKSGETGASPELVAKIILKAAKDRSSRLRYTVGTDARVLLGLRKLLPDTAFRKIIRSAHCIIAPGCLHQFSVGGFAQTKASPLQPNMEGL